MNEKIMVVDDHDDIREVIHVLLTNEGYQIIEAKNGKEALELLDDSIDLIILDVMMPEMNGYQVRGVRSMIENDAYCIDILTQVSAINAALNSFNKVLISNHIRTCVKENIQAGNDEVIDELVVTLQKLMK